MVDNNDWIKSALERIETKQDHQTEKLNNIDIIMNKQQITLDVHVKRTDLAEQNIELLRNKQENDIKDVYSELKPVLKERAMIKGAVKLGGAIIASAGVLGAIARWIFNLFHPGA